MGVDAVYEVAEIGEAGASAVELEGGVIPVHVAVLQKAPVEALTLLVEHVAVGRIEHTSVRHTPSVEAGEHAEHVRSLIGDRVIDFWTPIQSRGWKNQFAPIERARSGIPVNSDSQAAVSGGDLTDDLLTRAVTEALAAGMSWAQIAAQLGVPPPVTCGDAAVIDHDWQEAIVAHENARAARLNAQALPRRPRAC
ncbi:hypothetical protein R1X32_03975 (plasmid) [Rhodococcus opacus]|uniref:hypothetical protein n=1 Tax=Rhodococcus opacus TaxID=37919 RepID=UPI0020168D23